MVLIVELEIINDKGQLLFDSRQVAEKFGKRHDHVLTLISSLEKDAPDFREMFCESTLPDNYNRDQKIFLMNRDGFSLLAMGSDKTALGFRRDCTNFPI